MFRYPKLYDVIVIGAGHAGVEAAMAAARLGAQVAVLTQNLDTIGQMSCNPAIGGLAKGHMVREIDALGGAMGLNTDATGIQWRMLNASKGPSVRAPRAQCDKKAYQFRMKRELEAMPGVNLSFAILISASGRRRDDFADPIRHGIYPRRVGNVRQSLAPPTGQVRHYSVLTQVEFRLAQKEPCPRVLATVTQRSIEHHQR